MLTDSQIQAIVSRQNELSEVIRADEDYDAYVLGITIKEWRQKWIWNYLCIEE